MNAPFNLKHKPIIVVNDYDRIDSDFFDKTDAKALSLGEAQYDSEELSLKIWRNSDRKWSRQSEEIPINRMLDLCILTLASINISNGNSISSSLQEQTIQNEKLNLLVEYFEENRDLLIPKLQEIRDLINNLI